MRVLAEREPWMADGLCFEMVEKVGPAERDRLFFPSQGGDTKRGKAICADCPVRQECADYAIEHRELFGIWGGLSERERRRIRTARRREEGAA